MFGPSLLVAPVLEAGVNARTVYYPTLGPGEVWYDFWTGEYLPGQGNKRMPQLALGTFLLCDGVLPGVSAPLQALP
jgi:hypothetical protein